MSDEGKAIGWTDEIGGDDGKTLLPDGTKVTFKVIDIKNEKDAKHKCNVAVLVLACTSPAGSTTIKERLTMHTDFLWKINQFFTSIGLRKPGQPSYKLEFGKVKGSSGVAMLKVRPWTNDQGEKKHINAVDRFLPHPSFGGKPVEASPAPEEASGDNNTPF